MSIRKKLNNVKRIVFKFGTNALTDQNGEVALSRISSFVKSIAELKKQDKEIIIITSGAVGMGFKKLGFDKKPTKLRLKQACAAVGQCHLMYTYENEFNKFGLNTAQVLITDEDFTCRKKYLNIRYTLNSLLELNAIPIINANDTIYTQEIEELGDYCPIQTCFNDNDKLSAIISSKMDADLLVIMSDIDGLYNDDPRVNKNAKVIHTVDEINESICSLGFEASTLGTGGMKTKLEAADISVKSGGMAIIANGKKPDTIEKLFNNEEIGTIFLPLSNPDEQLSSKKRWIAYANNIKGEIFINSGASKALTIEGASLLPVGITKIKGRFQNGDVVSIFNNENIEIARGLVNYTSVESRKIIGKQSTDISSILGRKTYDTVIHRNNIVIL